MKTFTPLLFFTFFLFFLNGQSISNCDLNGSDDRWESQWRMPGTTATVHAMIEGPDGNVWLSGSYGAAWGGDHTIGGLVTWDGERYSQVGGPFRCQSCGRGTRYALKMDPAGNVYVGGIFDGAENTNGTFVEGKGLIRWNHQQQSWESLGNLTQANGNRAKVYAIELDTINNLLYVGGEFERIADLNGQTLTVSNIAAYDLTNQSWSAMDGGVGTTVSYVDGIVDALEMGPANTLYVGGGITTAGSLTVYSLASWQPGTGWSSVGSGLPNRNLSNNDLSFGSADALHYDAVNDRLYAGGVFGETSGSSTTVVRRSFAYFDNNSWTLVSGIGKPQTSSSFRTQTITIDPSTGLVYVGGNFLSHNGNNSPVVNLVGAWNPVNGQWNDLQDGLNIGSVRSMVVTNGSVFVGGNFKEFSGGLHTNNFIRWTGTAWDNLGMGPTETFAEINDLEQMPDGFIVAGNFDKVDAIDSERVARWRENTGWETLALGLYGTRSSNFANLPYALYLEGDWLYIGGQFGGINGNLESNGIAAYNLSTGAYKTWGTGLDGSSPRVVDITRFKGQLYISGRFDGVNGQAAKNMARLNPATDQWESIGAFGNEVRSLVNVKDSILLITGSFTKVDDNTELARVAVYNGQNFSALGRGINNGVVSDAVYLENEDALLVGGSFTRAFQLDGSIVQTAQLAKFKDDNWTGFNMQISGSGFNSVDQLWYDDATGLVYAGGRFTEADGRQINRLLRMDARTGVIGDLGSGLDRLDPSISATNNVGIVNYLAIQRDHLVIAGRFNSAGVNQANSLARYELENYADQLDELALDLPDTLRSCEAVTLSVSVPADSILWNTGERTFSILADESGLYSATVKSTGGCINSDSTYVDILEKPQINFEGVSGDSISTCDSLLLDPVGDFVEYSWQDGSINEPTFTVRTSGWVVFEGQDKNGCYGRDSVYATIERAPSPEFSFENEKDTFYFFVIHAQSGATYQWDFGDGNTTSGTEPTHVFGQDGNFVVTVVANNECGETTATQTVSVEVSSNQSETFQPQYFSVQPNPSDAYVWIEWAFAESGVDRLEIFDASGRICLQRDLKGQGQEKLQIDISALAKGVCFGRLIGEDGVFSFRFVKE